MISNPAHTNKYVFMFGVLAVLSILISLAGNFTGCANAATCGIGDARVLGSGLVANDDGNAVDSRIEGDTDEYLWNVDSATDSVQIGQQGQDASEKFLVNGAATFKNGTTTIPTAAITGGTVTGIADLALADGGTGSSTASGARTNLGLGSLATLSTVNDGNWSGTDLAIANGGTGASSASAARTALGVDPAGTDNSTDVTLAGTPDYITVAGQVITRNLIDLTADVTGDLPVAEGGTGSSTSSGARTNLGVAIGSDVQAYDADLSTFAGLAKTDGNFVVANGTTWTVESGATARTSLGLGSLATESNVNNSDWSGTDLSVANGGTGASSLTDHYVLVGSGTGAVTPVSPSTAGYVLTSNGTGADPTFQAAGGLDNGSSWRVTSSFNGAAAPISTNLEEIDSRANGTLGSSMTQASGVFTFPQTGIWYVSFTVVMESLSGAKGNVPFSIHTTTNNSTYNLASSGINSASATSHVSTGSTFFIMDVTDTSNVKVRFHVGGDSNTRTYGTTDTSYTSMEFIRLGDT